MNTASFSRAFRGPLAVAAVALAAAGVVPGTPAAPPEEKPTAPAAVAAPVPAPAFKRRDTATEEALLAQLAAAPEVGLGLSGPVVVRAYIQTYAERAALLNDPAVTDPSPLLQAAPGVRQLPYKSGPVSQLSDQQGRTLDALAKKLRAYLDAAAPVAEDGKRQVTLALRAQMLTELNGRRPEWLRAEAIPAMLQLLMHEDAPGRLLLVELLAEIPGRPATEALARRAVFDTAVENRQAAVAALRPRRADDYRPVFLKALRYPWAPAADHAAEALAALGDRGAVPTLVTLLKEPDPAGPQPLPGNRAFVQEVVRANHLANCMLCHPPAVNGNESVLGVDPVLLNPLPGGLGTGGGGGAGGGAASAGRSYRGGSSGGGGGGGGGGAPALSSGGTAPLLVRADITFLRQDFSVQQPVLQAAPGAPPVRLRFDYLLRTRAATRAERDRMRASSGERADYPQREAVLFALRELTGQDAGPTTEAWQELFPQAEDDVRAARLCREALRADGARQAVLLARLRDGKGLAHTLALAGAIPSLRGDVREKAREFLADRLARMTAETLRDKLADPDAEVRRAAVLACTRKGSKELVPDLIALLDSDEPLTARLAEAGLHELTGRDFDAPAAWRAWWRRAGRAGGSGAE